MKINYIVPSNLYPKKQFVLPNIMSEMEVAKLFEAGLSLKEYCVVGLLYGCGMRISEVCNLRIKDIESADGRIKVSQGKGAKDRYTLLPHHLLDKLRSFYVSAGRPKEYLFTSEQTNRAYCVRSMQVVVNGAMAKAGFAERSYTAHTLRHSFATHMLNSGANIHVIKTLLGHAKLETTMIYLHLQKHTQWVLSHRWINWPASQNDTTKDNPERGAGARPSELKVLMQRHIFGNDIANSFNPYSRAVFDRLRRCHTIHMGVHQYRCDDKACGHIHLQITVVAIDIVRIVAERSGMRVEDRMSELLPIKYYHVVFTLPSELRP
ncbi:MAG: tyrosine-type recombinase/integrase [Saprospiraceae bacterium]|nr:tyrosine-type recombinase/integrase [Candidatus Parvibacillus calidus]